MNNEEYTMTISRTTLDKLGIKMYDRPSAVIAELVANSYDADAESVKITMPAGKGMAKKENDSYEDVGYEIIIEDDGIGMAPSEINSLYLTIGKDRRTDRGNESKLKKRKIMGRKGIGKLAPFGICREIEIYSAGGVKKSKGYEVAHFILKYNDIIQNTDENYKPSRGKEDKKYRDKSGTKIILRDFHNKKTSNLEKFDRQMSRRFGISSQDFAITVLDVITKKTITIGEMNVDMLEDTKIDVSDHPFEYDGKHYEISGWVAYAREPYKDPDIAGVRIYSRGKIVSNTRDFGIQSGFSGEYNIRTYLIGAIHANWLDDDFDYIRSDRQDILWNYELVSAFQIWGQNIIKELGKKSRVPMHEKAWEIFLNTTNFDEEVKSKYDSETLQKASLKLAKVFVKIINREDLVDVDHMNDIKDIIYSITPHKFLVEQLKEINMELEDANPIMLLKKILVNARLAELASLGQIVSERLKIIDQLDGIIFKSERNERELQQLLEGNIWLINPDWTALTANQSFKRVQKQLVQWYKSTYGKNIKITVLDDDDDRDRPDFIMLNIYGEIEIVEIKAPGHRLENEEFQRLNDYITHVGEFTSSNQCTNDDFKNVHATLICDEEKLTKSDKLAFDHLLHKKKLTFTTWKKLLGIARKRNEDFVNASNA